MNNVLLIGSGGREHALAWKLAQSPQVAHVYVAPGNGGTALMNNVTNLAIASTDTEALLRFATKKAIQLTMVGPEAPLAAGLVDAFQAHGLNVCGPTQAAAQLESSKAFAKQFMLDHNIPTAQSGTFTEHAAALNYLSEMGLDADKGCVIKASGLAAGKGVIMCANLAEAEAALQEVMVDRAFGAAGETVLIEEMLTGPEVSMLGFCDGKTVVPMLPSRDHKRALNGDLGLNTGGMGAIAPVPGASAETIDALTAILQTTVDGMAERGTPYVGILYAGVMLTPTGPQVLEFNCRFGDPETQVILPMLDVDLYELLLACSEGNLSPSMVRVRDGACATIVLAAPGYPCAYPKGIAISALEDAEDCMVFHAGTQLVDGELVSIGGRVLAVSALGVDLPSALAQAYRGVSAIHFEGAHYRTDIGHSTLQAAGVAILATH